MSHEENDLKENGKKRRKRKRSQKQIERWVKYREKKKLEKKNNVNTAAMSGHYIAASSEVASVAACSTLRAEAQEFVPRLLATTCDLHPPSLSVDIDDHESEGEKDLPDVHGDNVADADEIADVIEESECMVTDNIHIDDDNDADDVFGIMTVYARSELHAKIDKVNITQILTFSWLFNLLNAFV